jgi:signal transduction histidine kinase/PAS domain-containing protein
MSAYQLSNIPYILLSLDTEWNIMDINDYGALLLEYEKKDIIGNNWVTNFIDDKDRENIMFVANNLVNGELSDCDTQTNNIISKSGKHLLISWKNTLIKDEYKKVIGLFSLGELISEQKLFFNQSSYTLQFLQYLFDTSSWLLASIDKYYQYISFNQSYQQILGELFKKSINISDTVSADEQNITITQFYSHLKKAFTNQHFHQIIKFGEHENEFKFFDFEYIPLVNFRHQVYSVLIIAKDISLQMQDERALRYTNLRLESLQRISGRQVQNVNELFDFVLQEALSISNSEFGYIFSYRKKNDIFFLKSGSIELFHRTAIKNYSASYHISEMGIFGEVIREKSVLMINNFNRKENGLVGIFNQQAEINKLLVVPVFISEHEAIVIGVANKRENYSQADAQQLDLLMSNSWHIIEKQDLYQQLKLAKEESENANKLQTEFLQNMSHEIRTPLNGINGFVELLANENTSKERKKQFVQIIQSSSNQLMIIIEDLLEISKLATKQIEPYMEDINLNDLVIKIYTKFEIEAKKQGLMVYLNKSLPDEKAIILADEDMLNRIFDVLLGNALKFTHKGYIEFGYSLSSENLILKVKDTGIGIAPEKQAIIFERFAQEDGSLTRSVGGLGLGLAIAREYAILLNGDIKVESIKGQGSTFYVHFPLSVFKTQLPEFSSENIITKILVVDDVETNYLYLEQILLDIQTKHEIFHTINGLEAVEFVRKNPETKLVIMDIVMPVMDGISATKLIKQEFPHIPVIIQSAYLTEKERAIQAGCDEFISKPISLSNFVKKINIFL